MAARSTMRQDARIRWFNVDALYATGVLIWIFVVWSVAFYIASEAIRDESAGVGGNSSLFACAIATAGVITAFSAREFLGAYRACMARASGDAAQMHGGAAASASEARPMTKLGLLVTLEAKPGKEMQLANFLIDALALVEAEPDTAAWFAIRIGPSTFGVFDAFRDEKGREAHLSGEVATALLANAPELLAKPPSIEKITILADKLPEGRG